jgi:hypothetical protein
MLTGWLGGGNNFRLWFSRTGSKPLLGRKSIWMPITNSPQPVSVTSYGARYRTDTEEVETRNTSSEGQIHVRIKESDGILVARRLLLVAYPWLVPKNFRAI